MFLCSKFLYFVAYFLVALKHVCANFPETMRKIYHARRIFLFLSHCNHQISDLIHMYVFYFQKKED